MRPTEAWTDGAHPLERAVPPERLHDVHTADAYDILRRARDPTVSVPRGLPGDEAQVSLDFAGGSLFELLNEIVRVHGRMAWSLTVEGTLVPLDGQYGAMLAEPMLSIGTRLGFRGTALEPRPAKQLRLPGSR